MNNEFTLHKTPENLFELLRQNPQNQIKFDREWNSIDFLPALYKTSLATNWISNYVLELFPN